MDELEKKPDAPQKSAEKKPERKNDFDNRRKLMYVLCGGYLIYLAIKMGRDYPGLAASGVCPVTVSSRCAERSRFPSSARLCW